MKLNDLSEKLKSISPNSRLDAEFILMRVLKKTRAQILMADEFIFSSTEQHQFELILQRYLKGEPLAYIFGEKEFWSLNFKVTQEVLIPRADTESMIEFILKNFTGKNNLKVADLGTGSGAIAIAIAYEKPQWKIHALDFSESALKIAQENAQQNSIHNIEFFSGDWCVGLPWRDYDLIVSNPPYIAQNDAHLSALKFEPQKALVSGEQGLDDLQKIIEQAPFYLKNQGFLIVEHGFDQAEAVKKLLLENDFTDVEVHRDLGGNFRFTVARTAE